MRRIFYWCAFFFKNWKNGICIIPLLAEIGFPFFIHWMHIFYRCYIKLFFKISYKIALRTIASDGW